MEAYGCASIEIFFRQVSLSLRTHGVNEAATGKIIKSLQKNLSTKLDDFNRQISSVMKTASIPLDLVDLGKRTVKIALFT